MKKKQVTFREHGDMAAPVITVDNARYQEDYQEHVVRMLKTFLSGEQLFIGTYRTDGVNLSAKRLKELEGEIPAFFQQFGEQRKISEHLSAARVELNDRVYAFLPWLFDYYLETTLFVPKAGWETFMSYHLAYQEHRLCDMICAHLAEFLVCYSDSGDISVCFDPAVYVHRDVREALEDAFGGKR